jgi:hypothetical protein
MLKYAVQSTLTKTCYIYSITELQRLADIAFTLLVSDLIYVIHPLCHKVQEKQETEILPFSS